MVKGFDSEEALRHEVYMGKALTLAGLAAKKGEVPIAAILVRGGRILAQGHNLTRTKRDPTGHAEVVVIQKAIRKLKNERFLDTILYVTIEPCAMCAGAIIQARIPTVVYGAPDGKAGACGSVLKILPNRKLNHRPVVIRGIRAEESAGLMRRFFRSRR